MVLLPFFASYSGLGFWNVLAVKMNHKKELKTPHGFPVFLPLTFLASHVGV